MPMSKSDAPGAKPKQEDVQSDVDAAVVAGTSEDVRNHEPLVEDLSPGQYAEAKVGVYEGEPGTERPVSTASSSRPRRWSSGWGPTPTSTASRRTRSARSKRFAPVRER